MPEAQQKFEAPESLESFLQDPEVVRFQTRARVSNVMGEIYDGIMGLHTTQAFSTAEKLKAAFELDVPNAQDSEQIEGNIAEAHKQYKQLIDEAGIQDEQLRELFGKIWVYSRLSHPVNELLEDVLAVMEGTEKAYVFASGLSAIAATIKQFTKPGRKGRALGLRERAKDLLPKPLRGVASLAKKKLLGDNGVDNKKYEMEPGGKIVVIGAIYGGTTAQIEDICEETGRRWEHMPISVFLEKGLPDDTEMVYFETSNNPTLRVVPIAKVVEEARRVGALTVCDNTFTPITVRPRELGVDLVVHSLTKYANGESEDLGGVVAGDSEMVNKLVWDLHHGKRMVEGAVMSPHVARDFLGKIVSLPERLHAATQNARKINQIALRHGIKARTVESYNEYPNVRTTSIDSEAMQDVSNGMVTLYIEDLAEGEQLVNALVNEGFGLCAVSLGAVHTYMSMPSTTTHSEMPLDEQKKLGITPGMVRISCGTEPDLAEKFERVLGCFYVSAEEFNEVA